MATRPKRADRCCKESQHRPRQGKEQKGCVRRRDRDSECGVERWSGREPAEQRKAAEGSDGRDEEPLADVAQAKVAEFMGEHGFDLRRSELLQECIEENDALVPTDAGEVGVTVPRAA